MKKSDISLAVAKELNISAKKAEEVVNFIFDKMCSALVSGDRIEVRGFGSFYVKSYKKRKGRNPRTGEEVDVMPKKLPFFKMGKDIKQKLIGE